MSKERREVLQADCWNVEALYASNEKWEEEFTLASQGGQQPHWPEIAQYKGLLGSNAGTVKKAFETYFSLDRQLSKLYTYAHLRHDEDITLDQYKTAYSRISAIIHEFAQETSWIDPELIALPTNILEAYLKDPSLEDYRFYIEKIVRMKPHTLSSDQERLVALANQALETPYKAFCAISDADFNFGTILDSNGNPNELTHASYGLFLRQQDRVLRENTFKTYHKQYLSYENSLCELILGQVKKDVFHARARDYKSSLHASLFPKNINTAVYRSLIEAVNEEIGSLHHYIDLRKQLLNSGQLHLYDMSVPLTSQIDLQIPYENAENLIIESTAILGSEYQELLRKGLKQQRWVDRYENKNKRSGAYSSGCYDSMPYILMNYKGILRDVFTLAHEAGHSMHSLLSRTSQPYHYSDYPIFLAEVASTFNEELLMQALLKQAKTPEEKAYLINQKIDDIRGTLFRQTMFAEFELLIHETVERNQPLTPSLLKEEYRKLNRKYFGPEVFLDEESDIEWARIPHFYYNFYVYQYATGISAALALADRVTHGGHSEREAYLSFLKGGSSKYPIQMLEEAGVDMKTALPVKTAIGTFKRLVQELEQLSKSGIST